MRERIRINGEPLSEEAFAKYSQQVWERLESTKVEALENLDTKVGGTQHLCLHELTEY